MQIEKNKGIEQSTHMHRLIKILSISIYSFNNNPDNVHVAEISKLRLELFYLFRGVWVTNLT